MKPPRNPFKPHGRNFPGARLPPPDYTKGNAVHHPGTSCRQRNPHGACGCARECALGVDSSSKEQSR